MKLNLTTLLRCTLLANIIVLVSACAPSIPSRPDKLGLEIPAFTIPESTRWTLENGLEVYYYFDDELPVMRARLYVHGGSYFDEFGIPGLASATGSQMRDGAIAGYTPEQFDTYLDRMAATIESSMGDEFGTVSLFCLTEDFGELFPIYAQVVRKPAFAPERLSLWKSLAQEGIRRRRDRPGTIASMTFAELVYGRGSKFSERVSATSVSKITPALLRKYHAHAYVPSRSRLAISGSLPLEQVKEAIDSAFADWPAKPELGPLVPPTVEAAPAPGIYVVERDLDQATITLGHLGPERHTKDFYALRVFSEIFGSSGFGSTLFQEIRTKRGLAYSVYGGIWPDFVAGTYQIGLQTRNEQAIEAIEQLIVLSQQVREELPDEEKFSEARDSVERGFVFKFAEPDSIVDRAAMIDTMGYPADFDARFLERIAAVSREDVRAAAERWITIPDLRVVIVGGVRAEDVARAFKGRLPVYRLTFDTAPGVITAVESNDEQQ